MAGSQHGVAARARAADRGRPRRRPDAGPAHDALRDPRDLLRPARRAAEPQARAGGGPAEESSSRGRRSAAAPGPSAVGDEVGRGRGRSRPGRRSALSRTRSAAAAASSAIAISVASSSRPSRRCGRASRRAGRSRRSRSRPRPGRGARRGRSCRLTITATAPARCGGDLGPEPPGGGVGVLGEQADRRRRRGRLEVSMPGVGADEAVLVSTIRHRARRAGPRGSRRGSARPARGSLPSTAASSRASAPRTRRRRALRTRPSAFETTFWATTTTSPSPSSAAAAISSPSRSPAPTSGSPANGQELDRGRSRAAGAERRSAAAVAGAALAVAARARWSGRSRSVGGVEVERQRGDLLDREADARLRAAATWRVAAARAEGGADRVRRGEDQPVGAARRGGRGRSRRSARAPAVEQRGRARAGRAAGSRRAAARRTRRPRLGVGRSRPAPASMWPGVGGVVETTSAPARAAISWRDRARR